MGRFYHIFIAGMIFLSFATGVLAEICTDGLERAMKEEGLSSKQIVLICKKALLYDGQISKIPELPNASTVAKDLTKVFTNMTVQKEPLITGCKLTSVTKTNGIRENNNTYLIEFNGNVSFLKTTYYYGPLGIYFGRIRNLGDWALKRTYPSGTKSNYSGSAMYKLTENGWRMENFNITIDDIIEISNTP